MLLTKLFGALLTPKIQPQPRITVSTDTLLHCTVANCQCPYHAAALACAQAGTKKQDGTTHAISASERRSLNPLIGHGYGYEELVAILNQPPIKSRAKRNRRKVEMQQENFRHAMYSILIRYPGQDIEVMVRGKSLCSNHHEQEALGLAINFINLQRAFGEPFHVDSLLLPKQSH